MDISQWYRFQIGSRQFQNVVSVTVPPVPLRGGNREPVKRQPDHLTGSGTDRLMYGEVSQHAGTYRCPRCRKLWQSSDRGNGQQVCIECLRGES